MMFEEDEYPGPRELGLPRLSGHTTTGSGNRSRNTEHYGGGHGPTRSRRTLGSRGRGRSTTTTQLHTAPYNRPQTTAVANHTSHSEEEDDDKESTWFGRIVGLATRPFTAIKSVFRRSGQEHDDTNEGDSDD
ncbi:hypothetical protein FOZ62_019629, partial [Perkinsus olseni]